MLDEGLTLSSPWKEGMRHGRTSGGRSWGQPRVCVASYGSADVLIDIPTEIGLKGLRQDVGRVARSNSYVVLELVPADVL